MPVDQRLEALDLVIGAAGRAIADPDQAQDAERTIDHPPLLENANEKITRKQRL